MSNSGVFAFLAFLCTILRAIEGLNVQTTRSNSNNILQHPDSDNHLIFPGGGIFFYWQAGFVEYLREQTDLKPFHMTGASAGALTATLARHDVCFHEATEVALKLAADAGVWNRKGGLQGIWGPMIEEWLQRLLPEDVIGEEGALNIFVTPINTETLLGGGRHKEMISSFRDKEHLIDVCMASVHLPWFLDGCWTRKVEGRPFIDGSFRTNLAAESKGHVIGHKKDPLYADRTLSDIVETVSPDAIWKMLDDGKSYARKLHQQGRLPGCP